MTIHGIKTAREFHKAQGWEDGPKDDAIDELLAEITKLCGLLQRWQEISSNLFDGSDIDEYHTQSEELEQLITTTKVVLGE